MAEKQGKTWWERVREQAGGLRGGFSRERSFQRMLQFMELVLMRRDYLGISSLVRASGKKGKESKVTFKDAAAKDKSKATLYMFFTLPGNFIAANFTRQ